MKWLLFVITLLLSIISLQAMNQEMTQLEIKESIKDLLTPPRAITPPISQLNYLLKKLEDKNFINNRDHNGKTLLMSEITLLCNPAIVEVLLKNNANSTLQSKIGETALHLLLREYANILWKSNPNNKWSIYAKYHPFRFYSAVAGITAGAGLPGYATWRIASPYFGSQMASIYTSIAKLFNNSIGKPS